MVIKETAGDEIMANSDTTTASKPTTNKTVIIAQEIKFARALAGNDPKLRRKVLKNLKTWLTTRSQSTFAFSDADFLRLWKGLFYCMWMSDKPLVQEELAESVGSLVRCFDDNVPVAVQFFKAFMVTMGIEWFGIDRWRMDKFMMFVRRVTRQLLFVLHGNGWHTEHVELFVQAIEATVLNQGVSSFGLTNHFNDLLLEEIAKVSDGTVPKETVTQIVEPYVRYVLQSDDPTVISGVVKNIFHSLMQQSELGQMYQEKFELWKKTNFITGDIDNVQFNVEYKYGEDDEEENDDEEGAKEKEVDGTDEEEGEELEDDQQQENGEEDGGDGGWQEQDADSDGDEADDGEVGEDGERTGKVYDPRAGRVSVEIPQIEFDPLAIVALFEKFRYKPYATSRGKKSAIILVRKLTKFANGAYPLGIKRVPSIHPKDYAVDVDEQVHELEDFRKNLFGEKPKSLQELKKEKQRLRKLEREQREAKMAKLAAAEAAANGGIATEQSTQANENPVTTSTTEQDESDAAPEPVVKISSLKKKKSRNKSPAAMKKEIKLELLRKKKQAKLLLLKNRLKELKNTTAATNGSSSVNKLLIPEASLDRAASTKQEPKKKSAVGKTDSAESNAKKQSLVKDKTAIKKNGKPFQTVDEWSEPLKEGEEEYFIPSRKVKAKLSSSSFSSSPVPLVKATKPSLKRTPPSPTTASSDADPITPARKRVKIALNKNVAQDLVEHIEQVKSSPQLPYDSKRKPSKSLLKPNLIPSPINPFYKKKIGLK